MNKTAPLTAQETFNLVLQVATRIHLEIQNDDAFMGYEGDMEAFNTLLTEVSAIAVRPYLILPARLDAENLYGAWYEVQESIGNGEMEVDWYRY